MSTPACAPESSTGGPIDIPAFMSYIRTRIVAEDYEGISEGIESALEAAKVGSNEIVHLWSIAETMRKDTAHRLCILQEENVNLQNQIASYNFNMEVACEASASISDFGIRVSTYLHHAGAHNPIPAWVFDENIPLPPCMTMPTD
jgi:hypothetical protein